MKVKAANGFARALKAEGIPWVSCYPTNHVNNALGEEGVPILMMGEERFAVAVADAYSRVTCGKQIGVCTIMANLNAAGIQMAYGAIGQAWEDSSPILVITEGVGQGAARHTHYDMAEALKSVTKWVGKVDRAELIPDYVRRAFTHLRSGRPGPVLLIIPRDLGEYDTDEHPYSPVKGWKSGPDRCSDAVPNPDKKTIIHCTVDVLDINRSYETRHAVVGDAKLTLQSLIAELSARGPKKNPELVEEIRKGKEAFLAKFRPWME